MEGRDDSENRTSDERKRLDGKTKNKEGDKDRRK